MTTPMIACLPVASVPWGVRCRSPSGRVHFSIFYICLWTANASGRTWGSVKGLYFHAARKHRGGNLWVVILFYDPRCIGFSFCPPIYKGKTGFVLWSNIQLESGWIFFFASRLRTCLFFRYHNTVRTTSAWHYMGFYTLLFFCVFRIR